MGVILISSTSNRGKRIRVGREVQKNQLAMQLQISLAVSDIPPVSLVNNDTAEFFAAPDQFQKNRNDRAFHAALEKIDKFSTDNVNTGENEFFRRAAAE